MFTEINNLKIHYHAAGQGEPVILLHGWGGSIDSFAPVFNYLGQKYTVYSLDLPGFGKSDRPARTWGSKEYGSFLNDFMDALGIGQATLIGHSFGGKVSICLAAAYPEKAKKLILVNSAGLIKKRPASYYVKVYTYKFLKKLLSLLPFTGEKSSRRLQELFGSGDYRQAGEMRQILVKVVNEDLQPLLKNIKAPTLLIWGENDQATPPYFGRTMEREIDDAGLVILKDAGHFSYLDQLNQFLIIIDNFLGGGKRV
ncbi:MAG: alpha/beta hydrolase [Halanaerobium sp.]|nr:alpha/beta hydrolase [Halanaerobium sp.]